MSTTSPVGVDTDAVSARALITHDLHIHTGLSACCEAKDEQQPGKILQRAAEMGLNTVGFSDHIWVNPLIRPCGWYEPQGAGQIASLREMLAEQPNFGVRASIGCEADMTAPGNFGMTRDFADTLDHVLLSCSHFHMKGFVQQPEDESSRSVGRHLLAFLRSGVTSGLPTSIAHPLVPFGRIDRFSEIIAMLPDEELLEAFGLAAENRVALEITTVYLPKADPATGQTKWSLETPLRILTLAKKAGCRFTFGTDAHSAAGQSCIFDLAPLLQAAKLEKQDILPL